MLGLEWSGAFLPNALNAALMVYILHLFLKGELLLRWSVLVVAWQFLTPRSASSWLDITLLLLTLVSAECVFFLVQLVLEDEEGESE